VKPVDPRLVSQASAARSFLVVQIVSGALLAVLVVAQATLIATLITRTFLDGFGMPAVRGDLTALACVVAGRALVTWIGETAAYRSSAAVKSQLRRAVLRKATELGPAWLARQPTGELTLLTTSGLDALDDYFARYLPQLILAGLVPAIIGLRLLVADPLSALIVICTLPLIPLFMALIGMGTRDQMDRQWHTMSQLAHHFLDVLGGLPTLRIFNRAAAQVTTVRRISEELRRRTMRTLRVAFLSSFALELLASLSVAIIAVSVGMRLVYGHLTLQTALIVLILAPEIYLPWRRVGAAYHASVEGVSAASAALDIIDLAAPTGGGVRGLSMREPIRCRGLRVSHAGRPVPALDDLNLVITPGEVLAITGPSGCGKSTLLAVLLGFVTPDAGQVVVGNVDLRDVDLVYWRSQIAWVGQRTHLFAATVAENIRLGRPGATDGDVRQAAGLAGAEEFIDALPFRYLTQLGERGIGLSIGQRQRIALARAFLKDAPLIVLDEPTAGLDSRAEAGISAALQRLSGTHTIVVTSHHHALFTRADRVVTLAPPLTTASATPTASRAS
jgi:thiol reductant ABC exporter CydD subunit